MANNDYITSVHDTSPGNSACAGCSGNCYNTCSGKGVSGTFGKFDDIGTWDDGSLSGQANACSQCTGTCIAVCGSTCTNMCSDLCTGGCSGSCEGGCALGCKGTCNQECSDNCGMDCSTSCHTECFGSCQGVCQGCVGCSNTCKNECENLCIASCLGKTTAAGTNGTLDFSSAEDLLEIARSLRFKKISEFPLTPIVMPDDQLAATYDSSETNPLEAVAVLLAEHESEEDEPATKNRDISELNNYDAISSDYSLNTVRITAANLVEYISDNIANLILWYPVPGKTYVQITQSQKDHGADPNSTYYILDTDADEPTYIPASKENGFITSDGEFLEDVDYYAAHSTIDWERKKEDGNPDPVDVSELALSFNVATPSSNGLMSAIDKARFDQMYMTDYFTQSEYEAFLGDDSTLWRIADGIDTSDDHFTNLVDELNKLFDYAESTYETKSNFISVLNTSYFSKDELVGPNYSLEDGHYVLEAYYTKDETALNFYDKTEVDAIIKSIGAEYAKAIMNYDSSSKVIVYNDPDNAFVDTLTEEEITFVDYKGNKLPGIAPLSFIKNHIINFNNASATNNGLMTKEAYSTLADVATRMSTIDAEIMSYIPKKTSELINDGYDPTRVMGDNPFIALKDIPLATSTVAGLIKVGDTLSMNSTSGALDLKNIKVANMLKNSTFSNTAEFWNISGNATITPHDNFATFTFVDIDDRIFQDVYMMHDSDVTLSFDYRGDIDIRVEVSGDGYFGENLTDSTDDWKHVTYHIKSTANVDDENGDANFILKFINYTNKFNVFNIRRIMLQDGYFDTGWIQHPIDTVFKFPYQFDNKTVILNNGIISSPSEIDDSDTFTTNTWSSDKIVSYIPEYLKNSSVTMSNPEPLIFDNQDLGADNNTKYEKIIFIKDSSQFAIQAGYYYDEDGELTLPYVDSTDIPLRIDMHTKQCDINGTAMKSLYATMDSDGNNIKDTYVTIDEFNEAMTNIMLAIKAIVDGSPKPDGSGGTGAASYVTSDEFNEAMRNIKDAIAALNDINP